MSEQALSQELQEIWELFREVAKRQEETGNQIREVVKHQKEQPYTIFIENLRHPSYRLRHPIPILIERNDEFFYATYFDLDMQGTGRNVSEALDDLCAGIIQDYEALKDEPKEISAQKYAHLKEIIEVKTETNPWIKYAGMFAEDPFFDEFLEGIGAIRKKIDEEYDTYLGETLEFFTKFNILPFNESAAAKFQELPSRLRQRIGTCDACITAIVLSVNGVLVTRNLRDFSQVPDLIIEDWTKVDYVSHIQSQANCWRRY
jgi:predicted nucleic acid-binding protein